MCAAKRNETFSNELRSMGFVFFLISLFNKWKNKEIISDKYVGYGKPGGIPAYCWIHSNSLDENINNLNLQ